MLNPASIVLMMKCRAPLLFLLIAATTTVQAASFFDDFSMTTNSSSDSNPWIYGTCPTAEGVLTPFADYTASGIDGGLSRWSNLSTETMLVPAAFRNTTGVTQHGLASGEAGLHGAENGLLASADFIAPESGTYYVHGSFGIGESSPTAGRVDTYVYAGGTFYLQKFNTAEEQQFSAMIDLVDGQAIHFRVGIGLDGFAGDTTPLHATIEKVQAVPEPTTIAALTMGLLAIIRRRRCS